MIPTRCMASVALRSGIRPGLALRPRLVVTATTTRRRIDQGLTLRSTSRAWESTVAAATNDIAPNTGSKETGHIAVQSNESVLFFDNLFPLKLSSLLTWQWKTDRDVTVLLRRFENSSLGIMDPIRLVKSAIPDEVSIKVTDIVPRLKDGGAFVKFSYDASQDPAEIEGQLRERLEKKPLKPWFNPFRGIKARLVRGTPWLEDLYRYPTNLVKVEFVPPEPGMSAEELSEESLYTLFRRYGKIADIMPQPTDSKVTPKYAHLGFPSMRDAIMARNCLHGLVVSEALGGGKNGTMLRLSYERRVKAHNIWNWIQNHPRIVIPIVAAMVAAISVIIFDPIRQFFVKVHIQHSLNFTESRIYQWVKSQTDQFSLGRRKDKREGLDSIWNHRRDLIEQLHGWLDGSSDTFIVVTGPKGSGKAEMVMDQGLKGRKDILQIDCKPIVEARGETATIRRLATAVGYRPVFSWFNSISSMVDLAVQSTTGVKAGFSETLEAQLNKILHTAASALKEVALDGRSSKDNDHNISEDAFLEAHPERRPVVVIENFLHKNDDKTIVYDKIAEWAASLAQNNIAHIIFLTSDSSFSKPLSKALPDRVFREISLGDLNAEVAKNFVISRLQNDQQKDRKKKDSEKERAPAVKPDLTGLESCIETLGGRLTDLEFLARRLKTGQKPREAVDEIVEESAVDIVKMFLLGKSSDTEKKWSIQQAWTLVKLLAENPSLRYNQVLLSPAFASSLTATASDGEAALESLTSAELITVKFHQGRPQTIKPGKPVHRAAFAVLLQDRVLRASLDLAAFSEEAKVEAKTIDSVEKELSLLGSLPKQTGESAGRITYLLNKMDASQKKISALEKEMGFLKKVLNEQY